MAPEEAEVRDLRKELRANAERLGSGSEDVADLFFSAILDDAVALCDSWLAQARVMEAARLAVMAYPCCTQQLAAALEGLG